MMAAKQHEKDTNTVAANSGRPPSPEQLSNSELVLGRHEPQHHISLTYNSPRSRMQIQQPHAQDMTHYHRATIFALAQVTEYSNTLPRLLTIKLTKLLMKKESSFNHWCCQRTAKLWN